jgi:YD repeat-containing protein
LKKRSSTFWHPPLWKWFFLLALIGAAVILLSWKKKPAPLPPVKEALLPFTDSPPAWDGSYPFLVISTVSRSVPAKFKSSVSSIRPSVRHDSPGNEFLVDLHTGRFILRQTDLFASDSMPLSLTRTYIAWDYHSRAFGVGTHHPYDICPTGTRWPYTYMDLNLEDFDPVHMPRISKGTGYADAVFRHSETSSEFYGAQIAWNGNGWTLKFRDGGKFYFLDSYNAKNCAQGAPTEMVDGDGHRIELKRDRVRNLEALISPGGHTITFKYDAADRIVEAADDAGNVRKYFYEQGGHVARVDAASHVLYRFEYRRLMKGPEYDPWFLTAIFDGDWNVLLQNKYLWAGFPSRGCRIAKSIAMCIN